MAAFDGVIPAIIGAAGAGGGGEFEITRSLRFNSADSSYLNRTPSSAGDRRTWTYSTWIKRSNLTAGDYVHIFGHYVSDYTLLVFKTGDDRLQFWTNGGASPVLETSAVLRDPSAWYHIVLAVDTTQSTASDRAHIYINGVEVSYDVDNRASQLTLNLETYINSTNVHEIGGNPSYTSTRYFNGYLAENHLVDGTQLSASDFGEYDVNNNWNPKAYSGSYGTNGFYLKFDDNSSDAALGTDSSGNGNTWTVNNLIGPGSDTTYSTALSVPEGGGFNSSYPPTNAFDGKTSTFALPANTSTSIRWTYDSGFGLSGAVEIYVTGASMNITFDDGRTPVTASADTYTEISSSVDFTWFNVYQGAGLRGNLSAVRVGGVVLTDSIYNDSLIDTPLNYTADSGNNGGNYCTWNFLDNAGTLANGNLDFSNSAGSNLAVRSTFALPNSGKWYAEFTTGELTTIVKGVAFGFANSSAGLTDNPSTSNRWVIYADAVGYIFANGSTLTSGLGTFAAGTLLQIAYDADTGKAWVGKNNTWYDSSGGTTGNPSSGTNQTFTLSGTIFLYSLCYANSGVLNAGQRSFAYTPPTDYVSLCTENLPDPTIADGTSVLDVVNETTSVAGSSKTISGLSFAPSLVISKLRNQSANGRWGFIDIVRGVNKTLASDRTDAEVTTQTDLLTQFNSDGFDVGADAGGYGWNYQNGGSLYTYWAWDSGSSTVSNTDGTITSNVRANQSAGFSIVTYTGNATSGATVGHGLNAKPEFIIIKNRDAAAYAPVYHGSLDATAPEDYWLRLFAGTDGTRLRTGPSSSAFNGTAPTSSVFSIGSPAFVNGSGTAYLAYCWTPVSGYSSFGSYTGAANLFIYTGFKPQWLLIKSYLGDGFNWVLIDSTRGATTGNVSNKLYPNLVNYQNDDGRGTETKVVFLSNGFTFLDQGAETNSSTRSYIYAAFAEHPFKSSRGGFQNIS